MVDLIGNIASDIVSFFGDFQMNLFKAGLKAVLPDLIGYAFMFCGGYVMLKALTGSGNILRPVAIVSGFSVIALAVVS